MFFDGDIGSQRNQIGGCIEELFHSPVLTFELTLVNVCSLVVTSLFSLLWCLMMHWILAI